MLIFFAALPHHLFPYILSFSSYVLSCVKYQVPLIYRHLTSIFFHQHQLGSKKSFVHILWSHYLVCFNVFVSNMYIHMSHNFLLLLFLIYVSFLIFLAGGTSISDYFFYLISFFFPASFMASRQLLCKSSQHAEKM